MENILDSVQLDEEGLVHEDVQDDTEEEPPNLQQQLDNFRTEWRQELNKGHGNAGKNKPQTKVEQATKLFLEGTHAEQIGELYVAVEFYRKAIQLVPDIESKIDFRSMRTPRDRQDSECSVDSLKNEEEVGQLLDHFQNLKLENNLMCQPKLEQHSTHISELPIEVIMFILRWVVSSDLDIRSLEMFSQVCRGFYLCSRDDEIWKLICLKVWDKKLGKIKKYGTYRNMYLEKPHLLFNGCYINKVSYFRPGEESLDGFYRPYHLVYYYRLIRLFPGGVMIMACSPDDPQVTIPKLRHQAGRSPGLLRGHYRFKGNTLFAELSRSKTTDNSNYRYKRRQVNQNDIQLLYNIEFEISSVGKGIHNVLSWQKYNITSLNSATNHKSVSEIVLTKKAFPPLVFSRVKSYTSYSEQPL